MSNFVAWLSKSCLTANSFISKLQQYNIHILSTCYKSERGETLKDGRGPRR